MGLASVICAVAIALVLHSHLLLAAPSAAKKVHIVHMKYNMQHKNQSAWYSDHFQSVTSAPEDSIIYSYKKAFPGFAATMSADEAESLRLSDSVLEVHEDTVYTLHTTRTPHFLGLDNRALWNGHSLDELNEASQDMIVGVLDTGVWPESLSFRDDNMPEVPARWHGHCDCAPDFDPRRACNRKLIGARNFVIGHNMGSSGMKEYESPRDYDGHGTHTASTAAGALVVNVSFLDYARGNARGMAPWSRLATYKVCGGLNCYISDILAGMDAAILDGVDVLSLSLGGKSGSETANIDLLAVAAFAAMERGIFVSCSAGNAGPADGSVVNGAPWLMTVGAGTIDREFPAFATLGNGENCSGVSLYSGKGMGSKLVELVYGGGGNSTSSKLCLDGSLDPAIVRGKVVLCDRGENARVVKGAVVRAAGGVGMILKNTKENGGEEMVADSHLLPALAVGSRVGDMIRNYTMTAKNPKVRLTFGGTEVNVKPSPVVAAFSSRGPNIMFPQILKPDVIGPGVNILAAWSGAAAPTGLAVDTRRTKFNIISGTSMSCPHISGLAALLKAAHPKWSPSAIKSALMTTAYTLDNTNSSLRDTADNSTATPWDYGSGYANPHKALSPGLVYDTTTNDYIMFLCSFNYSIEMIQVIARRSNITCARRFNDPGQLNYPSFSVVFGKSRVVRYTRVLTNVGARESVYRVSVKVPLNVAVTVKPSKLVFKNVGDKQRYTVTFVSQKGVRPLTYSFGSINWKKTKNQVTSLVSFLWTGS